MSNGIISDLILSWKANRLMHKEQLTYSDIHNIEEILKENISHYLNDRERYNSSLRRYLLGDSEV